MKSKGNWNGDKALKQLEEEAWKRILRATVAFWDELQRVLNQRINPPPYLNSAPRGEPPAKRTGFLAAGTTYETDRPNMKTRVGVIANAKYGLFLDRKNHPWFWVTLERMRPKLEEIMRGSK